MPANYVASKALIKRQWSQFQDINLVPNQSSRFPAFISLARKHRNALCKIRSRILFPLTKGKTSFKEQILKTICHHSNNSKERTRTSCLK